MNNKLLDPTVEDTLHQEFEFTGVRSPDTHYYIVETRLANHSSKGILKNTNIYCEHLKVEPGNRSTGEADRFTCHKFSMKRGDDPEVTIPSLEGFSYEVNKDLLDENGIDEHGQLYSVPEEKFEGLEDSTGVKLSFEDGYQVYSVFYYYHSYADFAEPTSQGKGVQDLKNIGDRIIVEGSFTESPIPGTIAKNGSFWKNGEITLAFNGLSIVDDKTCALLGLDSGVCHWSMPMTYMPIMNLKTVGVSNYKADIYLDLDSMWVRKLDLVLSEITTTTMWGIPVDKSIPRTNLSIRVVSKDEFEAAL